MQAWLVEQLCVIAVTELVACEVVPVQAGYSVSLFLI